jgi:hypothetical protein
MTKPKILILGWARHGKDTVAEILRDRHGFKFASSSMFAAESIVRPGLAARGIVYDSLEECYEDRVNHRAAWFDLIKEWNAEDPAALAKGILEVGDIYVGMRSAYEFAEARKLFDHIWWVDASGRGLPPEDRSSNDIDFEEDTMTFINNNGSLEDLHSRVWEAIQDIYAIRWAQARIAHG